MNITYCIFTYKEDVLMVQQCIRGLKLLGAREQNIFVFDDGLNPIQFPLRGCTYRRTHFNRNGNLNGQTCAYNMLRCMEQAKNMTNAEIIIKIDSDIVLNSLDWVESSFNPLVRHIGFYIGEDKHHLSGCCYALPGNKIKTMMDKLSGLKYGEYLGESLIITDVASRIGLIKQGYQCSSKNKDPWRAASIYKNMLQEDGRLNDEYRELFQKKDAILCDLMGVQQRDKKKNALIMEKFLDGKENK